MRLHRHTTGCHNLTLGDVLDVEGYGQNAAKWAGMAERQWEERTTEKHKRKGGNRNLGLSC